MGYLIPELLLLGGVLSGREDGVEDVFSVGVGQILRVNLDILTRGASTLTCFFPELDTSTGLEYFTRLWGWLKFVGPWLVDIL